MIRNRKYLFAIIVMVLFFLGCKPRRPDPIAPELVFTVVTLDNAPVANARVFIFKSEDDFQSFLANPADESVVERKTFTNVLGRTAIPDLEEIVYFIYVEADAPNGVGRLINTDIIRLEGNLKANTVTTIRVILQVSLIPKIRVFSLDEEINENPLSIWVGEIEGTPEAEYTIDAAGPEGQVISIITEDAPSTSLYIKNEQGCVWQREIELSLDDTINVSLNPCGTQKIVFHSSDLKGKTLDVFINDDEFIGQVSEELSTIDCEISEVEDQVLVIYRPEGRTYNFIAQATDGTCVKIDRTSISNSCQEVVNLSVECD